VTRIAQTFLVIEFTRIAHIYLQTLFGPGFGAESLGGFGRFGALFID
jgi:hypothetical protein